ncbi:centrosome-associated protein ALMS1 isoform X2 [Eleutherodactylus coqui]|uniref:centrosome-associated protein ALMS1 isoform X2 n=1 Tax=Eleutherodactylus coqui TaxID=57060 RepID=UPI0034630968
MDGEEVAVAESWYQLPAEEDASNATLGEMVAYGERTDFPSLEEGTLPLGTDLKKGSCAGLGHAPQLEVQDSHLSPRLPLLIADSSPGHKFFEDTLFQKTEVDDFAPLRASLDMSEFPGPPSQSLQMSDAVELASKEVTMDQEEGCTSLSQHYLKTTLDDTLHGGTLPYPSSFSHKEKDDKLESAVSKLTSFYVIEEKLASEDGAFLNSKVPAPVLLKLLEKEVGMSSSSGNTSRRSSKSSSASGSENANGVKQQEPDPEDQSLNTSEPEELFDPRTTSLQSLQESFRDSSQVDFLKDVEGETEEHSGITLRQSKPSYQPLKEALHKQLCSEIQQRYQERSMSDTTKSRRKTIRPENLSDLSKIPTEPPSKIDDTTEEAHLRDELSTSSSCHIERGHKDREMSHSGNTPVDEILFLGRLPHPISQSTPGTFTMNRKPLSGRIQQIKAKLTGFDMSLNEEPSAEPSERNKTPSAAHQSVQSSQGYPESSDSQRSSSPQRRRIQSLPSLNYIEKVGAWNTSQSFDALVLRGLTGVSPKKLAYNAVADSLNRMLSRQTSATTPKNGLSDSVKATSSMTNLSVAEKESSVISQITRSQSYNSVLPGRDQSEVEVVETTKSEASQSHVLLRGSSSTSDHASKWVEKNTRGSSIGGQDLLATQKFSDYKDNSRSEQEKTLDISGNRGCNLVTMDRFSDVSLDQDCANSSQSSNEDKEILQRSMTSAKHALRKREGTNDGSPAGEMSRKQELDIEERIPTYLRNLGIDQSPSAILTPFAPKGPIREPEFSPTELRTIKGSTATPSRSMRLSEGGSQSAVNISQSSLYSSTSTTSVSIPMGSDGGPESPLPTETSPPFGSRSDDRPISQDDAITRGAGSDPGVLSHHVERSPGDQPIDDPKSLSQRFIIEDNVESVRVKELVEQFGGFDGTTLHDDVHEQAPSSHGYSKKPLTVIPVDDSFVGSKTLKEIQKLLAEADDVALGRASSSLSLVSPVGDPYTKVPTRCLNLEDSLNSRSASPLDLLVKNMSWDSSFNSSSTGDLLNKDSSATWNNDSLRSSSLRDNSYLGEPVGNKSPLAAPFSQWGRSEPEGCSKAITNKMTPSAAAVRAERDLADVTERVQRNKQLLSSVSTSVGGLKTALAATGTGYVRRSEMESDESSGDSLAARVTNLLRNDTPSTFTAQGRQSAEEEERRARGSVKLRLTSRPMTPDTELSEEDRRRIEEIKRELLDRAKEAEKDPSHPSKLASSGDSEQFRLHLTPSPFQLPVTSSHDFMEDRRDRSSDTRDSNSQHKATYGGMTKDGFSVMSDQPPPTSAACQVDPMTELHRQEAPRRNVNELEKENLLLIKATEEATKPISSITFSSRKRSSPLCSSPDGGSQLLPSDFQVVFDKSPINQGLDLRPSSPAPSASHKDQHVYHEDPSLSHPVYKDVAPALVTSQQWRTGDSTTQESSASSWAIVKEYSAAASILPTSAPSSEKFSMFPCPQKENLDPGYKNVNLEGSAINNHDNQMESYGGEDQLRPYSGLISVEKVGGDGLLQSSSQEFQTQPTISSPTLKALSCIHVTISPKEDMKVLDVSTALVSLQADNGLRADEDPSRSSSANLFRSSQVPSHNDTLAGRVSLSSSHINPIGGSKDFHEDIGLFMGKENITSRLIQSERQRSPLSDATTQITTESPQKTTFSAEIFVEGSPRGAVTSPTLKVKQTFEQQTPSHTSLSCLSRATDQPLLLPYRPLGSPELFYVPFMEGGSRLSPVSTTESSHPGSNDAISPKFPPNVLGSATEKSSDPSIPRHTEGIYSKETSPETAEWKQRPARGPTDDLEASQHPRPCQAEKESGNFNKMSFSTIHPRSAEPPERSDPGRLQPFPASSLEDEFLPLQPEIDYSQDQPNANLPARSTALEATARARTYSATSTELSGQSHKSAQTPGEPGRSPHGSLDGRVSRGDGGRRSSQSVLANQSLDDLWARYTESRGRQMTQPSNKLEGSLVERLERLARLLQNPPPHSLMPSKGEKEENSQKRKTKKPAQEQWCSGKPGADSLEDGSVGKPYQDSADSSSLHSDLLSDVRRTVTNSATTESQTGSDTLSGSGSASTIDTIRLVNAFGPERVLPSSRLGRLYSTIHLQKKRTDETVKRSKRERAKAEMQELRRSEMAESESVASSNSLWEPSPALRQKRSSRRLNKGVQAGELEIVMSATRKNTRDVGTTFPSPAGERMTCAADPASVSAEANTRMSKNKGKAAAQHIPPGLSWFVPATNLKSESRKENEPELWRGPGPAWYEPGASTKPWREPLREKNQQELLPDRPGGPIHGARVIPEALDKPFIRVTLQESLRSHRPDFIFHSGERVKRLQLLTEERKLQSVFQGERDELFNQPPRSGAPRYKDSRLLQQNRTVPKKEMIQRSKRIYQQLPEIRKRKEEEKRRSEYETNRLKAQLYRKKVTNRVLGRKTPWN